MRTTGAYLPFPNLTSKALCTQKKPAYFQGGLWKTLKNRRVHDALGANRAESLPSIQNTPTAPVNNRNSLYICLLKDLWHETRVLLFFLREVPTEHFPCESACLLVSEFIGYVVSGIKLNLVLQLLGQVLLFGNWVFEKGRFLGSSSAIGRFCNTAVARKPLSIAYIHALRGCWAPQWAQRLPPTCHGESESIKGKFGIIMRSVTPGWHI